MTIAVIGTFLPWLRSGSVFRDSHQTLGVLRRLLEPPPALDTILGAWPLLIPVPALAVLLYVIGLRATAAGVALFFSVLMGTATTVALVLGLNSTALIGLSGIGPITTLIGLALTVFGALDGLFHRVPQKS
ncbi:hypothetical protein [Actinoalloteichus hymeniacidonis]|uniref:Uncharacterized protein n=1 Tax=Actinoalloteichus hymeniacidonis TaxID=340345 RepID=A0AAC9MX90_9PSEU|nr:hypothetical protein [Actinoalloteichus hymeniacidonis]AOS62983.1 hypothetical protein TL08_10845 [Actinoalloteichus hymeniacidonis]MBB5908982.1 hypothetical protein [Actinoalloteichus hymeniacidonis]